MKNQHYIRTLLGATQLEMAMLLRISRSQWSMYELGLRGLPARATEVLADMMAHAEAHQKNKRLPAPIAQDHTFQLEQLEHLLQENAYQQLLVARKMEAVKKKQTAHEKLAQRIDYLKSRDKKEKANAVHENLARHATLRLEKNPPEHFLVYEIRLEVLAFEKKLLEEKIQDLGKPGKMLSK